MSYTIMLLANLYESNGGGAGSSVISLIFSGVMLLANWFLFEKAGEPGWMSLVPFLNTYKMFEIVYGSGWKFLLLLVPILNIAVIIGYAFRLAEAYGKGIVFGFINLFFAPIGTLLLAFGNARYAGPVYKFI